MPKVNCHGELHCFAQIYIIKVHRQEVGLDMVSRFYILKLIATDVNVILLHVVYLHTDDI